LRKFIVILLILDVIFLVLMGLGSAGMVTLSFIPGEITSDRMIPFIISAIALVALAVVDWKTEKKKKLAQQQSQQNKAE
jgi:membrane protein implicated in regulation of membrane protease activity